MCSAAAAVLTFVFAALFDLLFFAVDELPATVPVALVVIVLEVWQRGLGERLRGRGRPREVVGSEEEGDVGLREGAPVGWRGLRSPERLVSDGDFGRSRALGRLSGARRGGAHQAKRPPNPSSMPKTLVVPRAHRTCDATSASRPPVDAGGRDSSASEVIAS